MQLTQKNEKNIRLLCLCMISVFFWGLAAHGYGFLHSSFSHDSLAEFNGAVGANAWKIQLGRVLVPVYKSIFRTNLTLPWMCGLLSLVWIGLAVFLTAQMLNLRSRTEIFLAAGVFAVNLTVTATAVTYLHDYDGNMFAMLCAVAAVYLWDKYRFLWIAGSVLLVVCMSIYQSYLSVAIVLVLMLCIQWLLNGETFLKVFRRGLTAVGMLLAGGVLYFLLLRLTWKITGITAAAGSSNSLDLMLTLTPKGIIRLVLETYTDVFRRLFGVVTPYPQWLIRTVTGVLLLLSVGMFAAALKGKGKLEALGCAALAALLPLGMNIVYVLSSGIVHDLMVYGIWLSYLVALLLAFRTEASNGLKKSVRWICVGLVAFLLYANVQTANVLYLKKDMEQNAFLSYMTRVVYTMENCEGYTEGQTPVVFVGEPDLDTIPGFEKYTRVTGADASAVTGLAEDYRARAYFRYVLNNPAVIPDSDVCSRMEADPRVEAMPSYPQSGSIAMIDDVLVVILSRPMA